MSPRRWSSASSTSSSASMSLAGHADTVSADIDLGTSKDSAAVTIVEASAARAAARMVPATPAGEDIVRRWTVTSDKPGQVALVFIATVKGQAAAHRLERKVPMAASARAMEPPARRSGTSSSSLCCTPHRSWLSQPASSDCGRRGRSGRWGKATLRRDRISAAGCTRVGCRLEGRGPCLLVERLFCSGPWP